MMKEDKEQIEEALGSKVKVIVGPWIHLNCRVD
jgi:hypothetical protein